MRNSYTTAISTASKNHEYQSAGKLTIALCVSVASLAIVNIVSLLDFRRAALQRIRQLQLCAGECVEFILELCVLALTPPGTQALEDVEAIREALNEIRDARSSLCALVF